MGKSIIRRNLSSFRRRMLKGRNGWWFVKGKDLWMMYSDLVKFGGNIVRSIFATIETPMMEAKMRLIQAGQIMASESLTASEPDPSG